MHTKVFVFVLLVARALQESAADESQFAVNGHKAAQLVSERFISFSVDPAVFFTRLPQRRILMELIAHLSPAYLRVAGPSTPFVRLDGDERQVTRTLADAGTTLTFSPAMWWQLNAWIQRTNFTPIFGVSDEPWDDAQRLRPLLEMTANMHVACWWQLGFDCSKKGFERYKADAQTFRKLVDTTQATWHVVGSDLSRCTPSDHAEILRMYLADLEHVDAIFWEEDEGIISSFLSSGVMENLLTFHPATVPIWLSMPKSQHPIGFEDGITWAVELGEAARKGFAVVFREPRVQEYYSATPVFWVAVLHKSLMGRNVLDVKMTPALGPSEVRIYAHCAADQNSFSVRGALTVMIVNNSSAPHMAAFRLPSQLKSVEVRSYVLTTMTNSTETTYLNGEPLRLDDFRLLPKLRRAKVLTHLQLAVPGKSVAFFVLPAAKLPVCIDAEDDTARILAEMERVQAVDFAHDAGTPVDGLLSRSLNTPLLVPPPPQRLSVSLADVHRQLQEEFKTDAVLVPKMKLTPQPTRKRMPNTERPVPINAIKSFNLFPERSNAAVQPASMLLGKKLKPDLERSESPINLNLFPERSKVAQSPSTLLSKKLKPNFESFEPATNLNLLVERNNAAQSPPMLFSKKRKQNPNPTKPPTNLNHFPEQSDEIVGGIRPLDLDLHLSSSEVFKILGDRARAMVERKIGFGDFDFDLDLDGVLEKALRRKVRRDINMQLLEEKVHNQEEKEKRKKKGNKGTAKAPRKDTPQARDDSSEADMSKILPGFGQSHSKSLFGNKALPKLDLFRSPDADKLDLQSLLSLLRSKAPSMAEEEAPNSARGGEKEKWSHGKETVVDPFDSFHDYFGDTISVQPKATHSNELGAGWNWDDAFLDHEFIVNDDDVPGAIHQLETYFNRGSGPPRPLDDYFEPSFDSFETFDRYQRSVGDVIKAYESKVKDVPQWHPKDMLKLPQRHVVYSVGERPDRVEFKDIPKSLSPSSQFGVPNTARINIRNVRRAIDDVHGVDSAENTIEDDTVFAKEVKFLDEVLHATVTNRVEDSTCPATDFLPLTQDGEATTKPPTKLLGEKRINRSEYIQKIPRRPKHNRHNATTTREHQQQEDAGSRFNLAFVTNIIDGFSRFMKELHSKVDSFFEKIE